MADKIKLNTPSNFDEPMNPNAAEDFERAVRETAEATKKGFEKLGKRLDAYVDNVLFAPMDELPTEYGGIMKLDYRKGIGAWQDVVNTLIAHGYEVTARKIDATETEKNLDGIEQYVEIEFSEVE